MPQKSRKMPDRFRANVAPFKKDGARAPEVVPANPAKPGAPQKGLEELVEDVRGVYRRADGAEHEAVTPPIRASSAWGEPSTAWLHRTPEKGRSAS